MSSGCSIQNCSTRTFNRSPMAINSFAIKAVPSGPGEAEPETNFGFPFSSRRISHGRSPGISAVIDNLIGIIFNYNKPVFIAVGYKL